MIPFAVGAVLMQSLVTAPVPFAVGERYEYSPYYSLSPFGSVGTVSMSVTGVDTVRGVPSWHFTFLTNLSALGLYKANSRLESWVGVKDFTSRRFVHFVNENGKQYSDEDIQIHADSGYFRNRTDTIIKGVPQDALDDLSFIYHIRTLDYKDGASFKLYRYFRKDHNPVEVTVLKRDTLDMPDGSRRRCWVVRLVLDDGGMFSRKSNAKVWLSDDGIRIPMQIQSDLASGPGHVTLKLKKISHAP